LRISLEFIRVLEKATLDNGDFDEEQLHSLRHPVQHTRSLNDKDVLLSLKCFLATMRASNQVYSDVQQSIEEVHPQIKLQSHHVVQKTIANLTGIFPIIHDMCPQSCLAYTGPFLADELCSTCREPRYNQYMLRVSNGKKRVSRQRFYTMPLGPQLQAI
ncbi:hypothetical protein CPB83DRAFT_730467, partial [Crepidotus variabilis]